MNTPRCIHLSFLSTRAHYFFFAVPEDLKEKAVEPDKEYEVKDLPIYRAYKGKDCIYDEK